MHEVVPKVLSMQINFAASHRVLTAMKDDLRDEIVRQILEHGALLRAQKRAASFRAMKKAVTTKHLVGLVTTMSTAEAMQEPSTQQEGV